MKNLIKKLKHDNDLELQRILRALSLPDKGIHPSGHKVPEIEQKGAKGFLLKK